MHSLSMSNRTSKCMSIFLSYFTRPVWSSVDCDHEFHNNYFVCEMKSDEHKSIHAYVRSSKCCPIYYTYVNGSCWCVSTKTKTKTLSLHWASVQPSKLFSLLTSWSLGDSTRTTTWLHWRSKREICLKTVDFNFQPYKDWFAALSCNSTYLLRSHRVLTYSMMCIGTV